MKFKRNHGNKLQAFDPKTGKWASLTKKRKIKIRRPGDANQSK